MLAIALATVSGCGDAGPSVTVVAPTACVPSADESLLAEPGQAVPLFPSASDPLGREGMARVINHSGEAGEVSIRAFDDEGEFHGPLTLSLGALETVHFNSEDLENGNPAGGLTGCTGAGEGDWRLELASELDIEVLSYIRTMDGFLTAMHDTAPWRDGALRIATFNPGSDLGQESSLRLVNVGGEAAAVTISGIDDMGGASADPVTVELPAGDSRTYSARDLESGNAAGLDGSLGDGVGRWQLSVRSDQAIMAMSLLATPTGHLTNLSTVPGTRTGGVHRVPLLPSASSPPGGLLRVINRSDMPGEVSIRAFDDTGREHEALFLSLGANETKHIASGDLEMGNPGKGLTGSTGAGEGDWRLALTSGLEVEVLAYATTTTGFLAAMHDTVPQDDAYRVTIFNPAGDDHESRLRLVNAGESNAQVTITGIDERGESSPGEVSLAVSAGASRTLTAREIEDGVEGSEGGIGTGVGRWQLVVESETPITVLNLLAGSAGLLANLSSRPARARSFAYDFHRGEQGFAADFADYPPAHRDIYRLMSDHRSLPPPLESGSALYLSGVNRSDDLFMFFKGQVGGLVPGARYEVAVSAEIATDTPSGCIGIGGAPGESVWIKAGATTVEPLPVLVGTYLRMNVDIGSQSNSGEDAVVLGNVANSRSCEEPRQWERKSFEARSIPARVSASPEGRAWLLFGVDSGFEGRTEVYFTRATAVFTPM